MLKRVLTFMGDAIDARDLMLYAGLGLLGYGLYQIFPPAAFAIAGAILVYVAIFGVR
ncbi:MAG: hypothetical protein ACREC9_15035 [Methylocella sp.]